MSKREKLTSHNMTMNQFLNILAKSARSYYLLRHLASSILQVHLILTSQKSIRVK